MVGLHLESGVTVSVQANGTFVAEKVMRRIGLSCEEEERGEEVRPSGRRSSSDGGVWKSRVDGAQAAVGGGLYLMQRRAHQERKHPVRALTGSQ